MHPYCIQLLVASVEHWLGLPERRELGKALLELKRGGGAERDEGFALHRAWLAGPASDAGQNADSD